MGLALLSQYRIDHYMVLRISYFFLLNADSGRYADTTHHAADVSIQLVTSFFARRTRTTTRDQANRKTPTSGVSHEQLAVLRVEEKVAP